MAISCRVLVAVLLGLKCSARPLDADVKADAANVKAEEQCDSKELNGLEDVAGHALLATKVVQKRVTGLELPSPQTAEPVLAEQQIAAIEQLRAAMVQQGNATTEQLQRFFDMTTAVLSEKVSSEGSPPNALLDANATQPFKGDNDPAAARDRFDRDYVKDGEDEIFFPKKKRKRVPREPEDPDATLAYNPEEPVEKKHVLATYVVIPLAAVFFLVFTLSNVMEKFGVTAIPESGIMIAVGVGLGTLMKMYAHFDFFDDSDYFGEMNSVILNLILLPIIIFASGWAIRRQDFYSQFPYILMFATIGVALSTITIASLIVFSGSMGLHGITRWRTSFAYAALISATDPVATLSTYAKLKVDPLLNIMVFGESIINDAVAIVLFNIFNSDDFMIDKKGESLTGVGLLGSIGWGIVKIFGSSVILGGGLGMIYTLIAHWADMRHNKKGQILNIFASCYLTYAIAESIGMSGIIAVMFAALTMGIYMRPHLSSEGSLLATFFIKQLATLADAAVCLLIGVSVVQLTSKGWYFGVWVMLFCLIGRFAAVFPVGYLVNLFKTMMGRANGVAPEGWNLLTTQHMFMMWHAGLRGAIALALSLELGKWVDVIDGPGTRRALQTSTFLLICTFLLVFGGSTQACLNYLGIPIGKDCPANHLSKTEDMGPLRGFLMWLDKNILSPVLIGKEHEHRTEEEKDVEDLLKISHTY